MNRHKRRMTLAAAALVPLAVACAGPEVTPLYGTRWTVTSPPAHGRAYLVLDQRAGRVGGRLGCNRVSATATVRDGHITLGRPVTTRMMCDASLMRIERTLLGLFDGRVSYRVDHDTLTLTRENGTTVRAVADN